MISDIPVTIELSQNAKDNDLMVLMITRPPASLFPAQLYRKPGSEGKYSGNCSSGRDDRQSGDLYLGALGETARHLERI